MLKTLRLLLYLFINLCTLFPVAAQSSSYTFTHLGVEDGLANNFVLSIAQDKKGCIWFATENGLSRFDGYTFTNYRGTSSGLRHSALRKIYYDKHEDKLWICGLFDGLYTLDCTTYQFQYYNKVGNYSIGHINELAPAADGGLWFSGGKQTFIHYNPVQHQFSKYILPHLSGSDLIRSLYDDGLGKLYVGYSDSGLDIIDLKTKKVQNFKNSPNNIKSLPGNRIYDIVNDNKGNIWMATNAGLALFHPTTGAFTVFRHDPSNPNSLISDHLYTILPMKNGYLWIGSDIGGISILDTNDLSFRSPSSLSFHNILPGSRPGSLSSGNIRSLLQDTAGNIWVGNYSSGVNFLGHESSSFSILPYMTTGPYPTPKPAWGLYIDQKQQLWVGGENEVSVFLKDKLIKTIPLISQLSRSYVQVFSIIEDKDGNMLFGLYDDGMLKYNTHTGQLSRIPLEPQNTDIVSFYKDADQTIWVGTEYGIYHYNNGRIERVERLNRQLKDPSIYGILRDRQGKLWVSTFYGGISVFDKTGRCISHLGTGEGFCSNAVTNLAMDSRGGIWAATRNGIGYIPDTNWPTKFHCYGYNRGITDNYVRSIQEDSEGNIWVSTNNGISHWNRKEDRFENYDYRDGLPSGNFIEGSSVKATDGTLYFGSLKGVCYFTPQTLLVNRHIAPIQIIACTELNGQTDQQNDETVIPITDKGIELPYYRNSFRISFSVSDYALSRQVEYAYQIKGLDDEWTNTSGENAITFRNLPYGNYTFKVKVRLKNQQWDEAHVATLKIHIHPPFWLTWYAKAFYILLILSATGWGMRIYKRRLQLRSALEIEKKKNENEQELNKERLRFYTNITHELRTPLTLILGPLEDLTNDRHLPTGYQPRVQLIYNSAKRLLNLINQLLEFRKTETQNRQLTVAKEDLSQLVTETGLRFKELNRNNKVQITIHIETNQTQLYFDREIITTVLNNLLSNAVKYTPEGTVNLTLRDAGKTNETAYTEIVVSDTGYGIDREALPHIFERYYQAKGKHQASGTGIGLALVRSLVQLHEGLLHVESEPGKGTTFTVSLKTMATYPAALHKERTASVVPPANEIIPQEETDRKIIVLVVEDNDDIRDYIASSFDETFKVLTADNGEEGWKQAENQIPDIIISDIMMPVMDGIELCRKIKEDIRTSHIPVILLTAKDSIQDKEEGYDSGADSYLTKPFSAKLLLSRVHNLLESRRKLAQIISGRTAGSLPPSPEDRPKGLNKVSEEFLKKFIHIVEENITKEELDMPFMADKMAMSHSTLYRKIKSLTGGSGNEYIRKIKLKYSIRLMQEKGLTISEAAYNSGFNDISYYRRCFKKEYGLLPSEYIKKGE